MDSNRKFLQLRVGGAKGAGFPPDHLYWERKNDAVDCADQLKFSGCWTLPEHKRTALSLIEGWWHRKWDWQETSSEEVHIVPKWAGKEVKTRENIYKILGFRECQDARPGDHRDSYTLVVELIK